MMLYRFLILIVFLFLTIGCEKENDLEVCIEKFIVSNDLIEYRDQEIGGKFYYELNSYDGGYFFSVGHHYIDFVAIPQDCNGNEICVDLTTDECLDLFDQARNLGIIAVGK